MRDAFRADRLGIDSREVARDRSRKPGAITVHGDDDLLLVTQVAPDQDVKTIGFGAVGHRPPPRAPERRWGLLRRKTARVWARESFCPRPRGTHCLHIRYRPNLTARERPARIGRYRH
jgi:hypothetical protein